jgi:hypothetical protein
MEDSGPVSLSAAVARDREAGAADRHVGTGKSSVIQALAARGYKTVDTDDGWCEPLLDGRQRWREDAIERLLAVEDAACSPSVPVLPGWAD